MNFKNLAQNYWKVSAAVIICWTFLAILFTPQTYFINRASPTPLSFFQAFIGTAILFYVWAILTPAVLLLGKRFPLERRVLLRNTAIQLIFSLLFALIQILLLTFANSLFLSWLKDYQPPVPVLSLMVGLGATNVMIYWGVIAVSQAVNYFRKFQEREIQLSQAQLQILRMQLHPHFLFNTINAISELLYDEPEIADQTLEQLSDLLRFSLKSDNAQQVSLREELDFLEKYIEIQKMLLQERLTVEFDIAPNTLDASVPNMILQPLAENAIRHGIAPSVRGGKLKISAKRVDATLLLKILDDGLGLKPKVELIKSEGIGLANTRARLEQLYGKDFRFEISEPETGGVSVVIVTPFEQIKTVDEDKNINY